MVGPQTVVVIGGPHGVDIFGRRGWDVNNNVLVGAVVVTRIGYVVGGARMVKLVNTSWWSTKGCSRGGTILGSTVALA